MRDQFKEMDMKELEFADTVFIRDIESRVFQAITFKCLQEIEGVALLEGNLIDNLLGRDHPERMKGVYVEQDQKNHAVNIRVELNIAYGISIPEKAEEIQTKVVREISRLTGLHVGSVHIIFKSLISHEMKELKETLNIAEGEESVFEKQAPHSEYSDDF